MACLRVDQDACAGHGLCYGGWPELFDARDDGIAVALVDEIPDDRLEAAREAAAACPEQAITIVESA